MSKALPFAVAAAFALAACGQTEPPKKPAAAPATAAPSAPAPEAKKDEPKPEEKKAEEKK
jgi:hypothetical protein